MSRGCSPLLRELPMPSYSTKAARTRLRQKLEAMVNQLLKRELKFMGANTLYLVFDSDSALDFSGNKGFTCKGASVDFRAEIGDRWRGPGPCIFLNVSHYRDTSRLVEQLIALLIHELAHVFQFKTERGFFSEKRFTRFTAEVAEHRESVPRESTPITEISAKRIAWSSITHGHDFIRPLIHLMIRAEAAGWSFNRDELADWDTIGFTGPAGYVELLTQDLRQLARKPLQAIHEHEPDIVFLTLCKQNEPRIRQQWEDRYLDDLEAIEELKEIIQENAHWERVNAAVAGHRTITWF